MKKLSRAFASIMALYQYDPDIFSEMVLPDGVDLDLLTDNIMIENGELGLIYADPVLMKHLIGVWSQKDLEKWTGLYATTQLEYNAIENYNRTEVSTESNTETFDTTDLETRDLDLDTLETRDLAGSNDETRDLDGSVSDSGDDVTTRTVNAYNSGTGTQAGTDTVTHGLVRSTEDNGTVNRALTDTGTVDTKIDDEGTISKEKTGSIANSHSTNSNISGNIGVTTTQQMIEQERKVKEFNIYDYITDSFRDRFCIRVW